MVFGYVLLVMLFVISQGESDVTGQTLALNSSRPRPAPAPLP